MKLDSSWTVFFDAGHTLLYPCQSIGSVYADVALRFGVESDPELLDERFRDAWQQLKVPRDSRLKRNEKDWWKSIVKLTWKDTEQWSHLPFDEYFEAVFDEFAKPELWAVYPDVRELLDWLQQHHIPCGILSNWDERLRPLLTGHELNHYFDPIIISSEHGYSKPSVELFRIAENEATKSSKYLLVGDDTDCDRAGANAAGWEFFHIVRPKQDGRYLLKVLDEHYIE